MTENDFLGGALFSGLVAGIFDKDARRDDGLELGFEHGNGIRNPSASIDGLGPRLKIGVILGHFRFVGQFGDQIGPFSLRRVLF